MKQIKSFLKSIAVAFSIYSKIPMPGFKWESEDMKYHFIFFPVVGMIIGISQWAWFCLAMHFNINQTVFGLISLVITLLITGGIHADGFMDTCDALHSYQSRERKLEILKDPHIGAFSVICILGLIVFQIACATEIMSSGNEELWILVCLFFAFSRAVSAVSVLNIKPAKEDGMLRSEADSSNRKVVSVVLICEMILLGAVLVYVYAAASLVMIFLQIAIAILFRKMIMREFGGISGDLAGYLLCISEAGAMLVAAIFSVVLK